MMAYHLLMGLLIGNAAIAAWALA
ncbi:hypothetical protein BBta_6625 [Bradyrhizobium sp. BTAi1]|nr:hypothetical protein BBta_6625 [Bradyrhizobium sp. BTAi1]